MRNSSMLKALHTLLKAARSGHTYMTYFEVHEDFADFMWSSSPILRTSTASTNLDLDP